MPTKAAQLRRLLTSDKLEFILEAHNGISARIVEEAGFKGIWASGLALSAQFGVRDNNEASWTQIIDMLEFMSDATRIPILLDGDTGYGNFNNMRRLVKKLEQRSIAGVCIEDKLFPKSNSFIEGERQPLADIDEFCGKIKAGKDSQQDDDFSIVARIEALIAGWDVGEAIRRAEAYAAAGADAILIHSKLSKPTEILEFAEQWDNRVPVVIVPTKYYSTPTEVYSQAKISLVIWANHMIRSGVANMQTIARTIHETESLIEIEDKISSVNEIFRLQGADELIEAEQRYTDFDQQNTNAIVLAASRGKALAELTEDRPKVMLPVGGKPLLQRLVTSFKKRGINNISVVAGYKAESINVGGLKLIKNNFFDHTSELASLICAKEQFSDDMLITYGDLLFRGYVLEDLLESDHPITLVVDSLIEASHISGSPDYAYCSSADDRAMLGQDIDLIKINNKVDGSEQPQGRWIGMLRITGEGRKWFEKVLDQLQKRNDPDQKFDQLGMPDLLNELVTQNYPIKVFYINGHWLDINTLDDLDRATDFTQNRNRD